jgi:predicted ATPase
MAASLTQFRIEGLHGRRTIDIPIEDNRLVLVGENGTGKSTVANLIYYTLTQQWRRVREYKFSALQVTASAKTIRLKREDIDALHETQHLTAQWRRHYPPSVARELYRSLLEHELAIAEPLDEVVLERLQDEVRVPERLRGMLEEIRKSTVSKLPKLLLEGLKSLATWDFGQFLYLPTYRRIEQDLESIFRGIEIEEKIREFRNRLKKRERTTFIELVEFGMEDVDKTIQARMAQIKESVRTGLGALTGTYLREVLRGLQDSADVSVLQSVDPNAFQSMFARIEETILPASDKRLLQKKIADISQGYTLQPEDKVIAHFLSKLVSLYKKQQEDETDVQDFVRLCNAYLTGKRFVYDDVKYEIYISQNQADSGEKEGTERLPLKALSSGEKQIVSLFSHMYLSGERKFFVVIDEPELSLSVPWQQRFLPDIMGTNRCTGLIAVTHSPFIWENDFERFVRALTEFIEVPGVLVH